MRNLYVEFVFFKIYDKSNKTRRLIKIGVKTLDRQSNFAITVRGWGGMVGNS